MAEAFGSFVSSKTALKRLLKNNNYIITQFC